MMHTRRHWKVTAYGDNEVIAEKLNGHTWRLCTAFKTSAGTVWANDSTSTEDTQDYAILRKDEESGRWLRVESISVGSCGREELRGILDEVDRGEYDGDHWGSVSDQQLEDDHKICPHCL